MICRSSGANLPIALFYYKYIAPPELFKRYNMKKTLFAACAAFSFTVGNGHETYQPNWESLAK